MALKNNLLSVIQTLTFKGYNIDCVFDIGANKGTWTAQYEPKLPNANFFLFEANPKHQRPRNLAAKHKWFNNVLSSPDIKEVDFYSIVGTGDSYYKEQTHHYNECDPLKLTTITLDEMVKEHSLPFPQLIKLDTQGSELDIMLGAEPIIKQTDIIIIEMAILPYNQGAPTFDDYINFYMIEIMFLWELMQFNLQMDYWYNLI